jgi:hypothetical protein
MPETEFVVVIRIPNPEVPIFGGLIDVALRLPRKVNLAFQEKSLLHERGANSS